MDTIHRANECNIEIKSPTQTSKSTTRNAVKREHDLRLPTRHLCDMQRACARTSTLVFSRTPEHGANKKVQRRRHLKMGNKPTKHAAKWANASRDDACTSPPVFTHPPKMYASTGTTPRPSQETSATLTNIVFHREPYSL